MAKKATKKGTEISQALQNDVDSLLKKAQQRGFVTQDEVLEVFVEP